MKLKKRLEHLLTLYDVSPKSFLSQHFLIDIKGVSRLLWEIGLEKTDLVLEIGAGTGILTSHLAEKAKKVWAVEVDEELCHILRDELQGKGNVEILCQDITRLDLDILFVGKNDIKVIGNLPYHIASWLLLHLAGKKWWNVIICTVQREVAQRLLSPPGKKTRGALTVMVSYYTNVEKIMDIPPQAFYPVPKVSSTVVRMRPREGFEAKSEELFLDMVKAGFTNRRKTLLNSLTRELHLPRQMVQDTLTRCGVPEKTRAEELQVKDFVTISNLLLKERVGKAVR